jgi:hypothetical protein
MYGISGIAVTELKFHVGASLLSLLPLHEVEG